MRPLPGNTRWAAPVRKQAAALTRRAEPVRKQAAALTRRADPARKQAASVLHSVLHELDTVDRAVFAAIAATPAPSLDGPLRRLSDAADNSVLWLVIAAGLGTLGGPAGRRAAVRGTVAIGVTSPLVNLAAKAASGRRRPDRAATGVPAGRNVRMPGSASFPSGHAASGFAFATAVGRDQPWLGMALRFLAAAVAYSRVHTGVHYPGDAVIGSLAGSSAGQVVGESVDRLTAARRVSRPPSPGQ